MLSPRWHKVLRDLSTNKTRTALVVVCLALGVFTISFLINAESMLRTEFDREFAAVNPRSASLIIPTGFDRDLVQQVRRMPQIEQAEGRRSSNVRLKVGDNQWVSLNISAIRDFRDIRIDKVQRYSGAWPPANGEILIERSSTRLGDMKNLSVGDRLTIQTADGEESTLKFTGLAYDFNRTPSLGTGIAYGYTTLDTFERLGEPAEMNELRLIVSQNKLDKEYIRRVANEVKEIAENSGRTADAILVPDPGQHPLGLVLDALAIVLGTLSILSLVGGALLVFNTIVALLAQQVRQIGMMKAVGASVSQLGGMYLGMVFVFGILALAIATPLATVSGVQAAKSLADLFNLDLNAVQIPSQAFAIQALIGFGVPFLAAIYPIWSGTRVTVREAISDYGLGKAENKQGIIERFTTRLRGSIFSRPVLLSLRNTFRRRARLILTIAPLALSGAILISVINVRTSLQSELEKIFIYRNYDYDISFDTSYRFSKIESTAKTVAGVTRVEGYHETTNAYRVGTDASQGKNISILGLSPTTSMFHLPVTEGRWLVPQDQAVAVINDAFLRDEPDIRVNDRVLFKIDGRKITFQVIGVVGEKMSPARIYVNDAYFVKMFGNIGRTNRVWAAADQSQQARDIKTVLESRFEQAGMRVASITPASTQRESIDFHFSIMIIPLGMAAFLLALVGGLGLMGTMSTNVIERQREIGVMRAIGASDGGVQKIFIVEGLFIGLISWLVSVGAALPLSHLLDDMVGNRFLYAPLADTFSPSGVLAWLAIVVVTVVFSCYLPARNASQTGVRELLAYE